MPHIEAHREKARLLRRWHRDGDYSVGGRVRQLERYASLTDRQVLALDFTLALAQEIVAAEAGYASWSALEAAALAVTEMPPATPGPTVLKGVIPVLTVRDVTASADFFRDRLGFAIDFLHGVPPFYAAVSRNGICLHLRAVRQPWFAEAARQETSLILAAIEVENLRGLFEEFTARGVDFAQTLTVQAWGGTDFHIRDPDGNVISFVTYG